MMRTTLAIGMALVACMAATAAADSIEIPCKEFHPALDYPCKCSLNDINATRINCDGAVFAEFPLLPYREVVLSDRQDWDGRKLLWMGQGGYHKRQLQSLTR